MAQVKRTIPSKDILVTLLGLGTTALLPVYIYWLNYRFFYIDDKVADYIPKLLDIARILKSGQFPFISTGFMNGSIYAAEYQEGIFNPLILLSALLLDLFNNLAFGSCILTVFFLLIAYVGYFLVAHEIGIRKMWANIFALSIVLNCFFIYWYTSAWFNPVNGTAFLPYALWSSLRLMRHMTIKTSVIFVLCCFLTVSAGWPATVIVMFLFLVLVLTDILYVQKNYIKFIQNLLIYCAAALVCTIPLLPLILSSEMFTRATLFKNEINFLVGSLKGLFMFAFPFFKEFINSWGGYQRIEFSMYYAAWYPLALLTLLDFKAVHILKKRIWIPIILTFLFGLAVLGPESLGPFRFPIRMIQYFHIFGLLSILLLSEKFGFVLTWKRFILLLSLLLLQSVISIQVSPKEIFTILMYLGLLIGFNSILFLVLKKKDGFNIAAPWVLIGSILILINIYRVDSVGRGADWHVPSLRSEYSTLNKDGGFVLFNGMYLGNQKQHKEFRPATTGLIWQDKMINGYSPLGNKFVRRKIAIQAHGLIATKYMKRKGQELFDVDAATGLELLELMKVSRVISFKGKLGTHMRAAASDQWVVNEKKHTFVFDHPSYEYPGHISWLENGIIIEEVKKITERSEQYQVSNTRPSEGRMIFARLWWPGYQATMNGKQIPLKRYSGFLIAADIPPQSKGKFILKFTPPGFNLGLLLACAGLVLLFVVNLCPWKLARKNCP